MTNPRAQLRAFLDHRRGTLARLRRVNEALSHWDEYEAAAAMPAALRPTGGAAPTVRLAVLQGAAGDTLPGAGAT